MKYCYLDFETEVSRDLTLKRLTVQQYLSRARILCVACALDDEEPVVFTDPATNPALLGYLRMLMQDPDTTFVAHNWAFDGRCLHRLTGLYPVTAQCSMEAAMCAWPNQPGGYSLEALAKTLHLASGVKAGHALDVMKMTAQELDTYVAQDTRLCRDVHRLARVRVPEHEWRIGELCNRIRECSLDVDTDAVQRAVEAFTAQADQYADVAAKLLDDGDFAAFGSDEAGHVKSVKPQVIKDLLLDRLGFQTHSISLKKADPVALAGNTAASGVIDASSKTNRALSHRRRLGVFQGVNQVGMELGWYRAHTGRFSSPSSGRGLNLHNLPKHDKEVAKLFRSMFRLPAGLCYVRADEASVEYRVSGLLSGSVHVHQLFNADVFADPYAAFGQACTGKPIDKKTKEGAVARQLFKMAVLGLGYGMGPELWTRELLKALAKPKPDMTLADLRRVCEDNQWDFPRGGHPKRIMAKTGCDPAVTTVAFHTRRLFHEIHPEFFQLAQWLRLVCETASEGASDAVIQDLYGAPGAPRRELVEVHASDAFEGYSVTVRCGHWPTRTVVWRDLGIRDIPQRGVTLSIMSGSKGYRAISPSVCVENVIQSAARNATCAAKLELAATYPYLPSVHDEIMPIVPATAASVVRAKEDLVRVMGPGGWLADQGWGWSVVIDPREINVSRSLYEVPVEKLDPRFTTNDAWWSALAEHPELLENLP